MSFVERSNIQCPFPGGSSVRGSTVFVHVLLPAGVIARTFRPIFVEREKEGSRTKAVSEIRRYASSKGEWPQIVIFPEGMLKSYPVMCVSHVVCVRHLVVTYMYAYSALQFGYSAQIDDRLLVYTSTCR